MTIISEVAQLGDLVNPRIRVIRLDRLIQRPGEDWECQQLVQKVKMQMKGAEAYFRQSKNLLSRQGESGKKNLNSASMENSTNKVFQSRRTSMFVCLLFPLCFYGLFVLYGKGFRPKLIYNILWINEKELLIVCVFQYFELLFASNMTCSLNLFLFQYNRPRAQ